MQKEQNINSYLLGCIYNLSFIESHFYCKNERIETAHSHPCHMRQHSAITNIPRRIRENPFRGLLHNTVIIIYVIIENGALCLDSEIKIQ